VRLAIPVRRPARRRATYVIAPSRRHAARISAAGGGRRTHLPPLNIRRTPGAQTPFGARRDNSLSIPSTVLGDAPRVPPTPNQHGRVSMDLLISHIRVPTRPQKRPHTTAFRLSLQARATWTRSILEALPPLPRSGLGRLGGLCQIEVSRTEWHLSLCAPAQEPGRRTPERTMLPMESTANTCACCAAGQSFQRPRICPACSHVFRGNGWDGIDAHWRSRHEQQRSYESFWNSLCQRHKT
jgi:hypothetical protein